MKLRDDRPIPIRDADGTSPLWLVGALLIFGLLLYYAWPDFMLWLGGA